MRHLTRLALCAALLAPTHAAAQGATGFPMGDVGQVLRQAEQPLTSWAPPPSLLERLSNDSEAWIEAEAERQAAAPKEPMQVALAVDSALGEDILDMARHTRIDPYEITFAIVLKIMMQAEVDVARQTQAAREAGDAAAAQKLAQAEENRKVAVGWASENALLMAAM